MKQWLLIFLIGGLLGASISGYAQQCGYGAQDGGQCVPADQVPGYQDSLQDKRAQPQQPQVQWASRYGAVAMDDSGAEGHITDQPSKSQAEHTAMNLCAQHGGKNCEILVSYYNSCAAIAQERGGGVTAHATAPDAQQVQQMAIKQCGLSTCQIVYSACSLPVRVQ